MDEHGGWQRREGGAMVASPEGGDRFGRTGLTLALIPWLLAAYTLILQPG